MPFDITAPPIVDVTVRDKVVEPGQFLRVVLSPDTGLAKLDGELSIERAQDPSSEVPVFVPMGPPLRLKYEGPLAESVGLLIETPKEAGGYRVAYRHHESAEPTGSDEFFIQQPHS